MRAGLDFWGPKDGGTAEVRGERRWRGRGLGEVC